MKKHTNERVQGYRADQVVTEIPEGSKVNQQELKERHLLAALIVSSADQRAINEELKHKRNAIEVELLSGEKFSLGQIADMVTQMRQPYAPMFPNDVPFFKEMFRLLGWTDKDPNKFTKPAIVGGYINQLLYYRYKKEVQPTLHALAVRNGIRLHKFFQYLTQEGQEKLKQFRDEAIELMKKCENWYEFRAQYGLKYGLPVQQSVFETYTASKE